MGVTFGWNLYTSVSMDDCKSLAVTFGCHPFASVGTDDCNPFVSLAPNEFSSVTVVLCPNPVVFLGEDRRCRPPHLPLCLGFLPDEEGILSVAASSIK